MNASTLLRCLLLLALVGTVTLSAPRPTAAQPTRTDSAAVLLAAAENFVDRGAGDIAEALPALQPCWGACGAHGSVPPRRS